MKVTNEIFFNTIEVKFHKMKRPMFTRALRSFIDAYNPEISIVISKNLKAEIKMKDTIIHFVPFQNIIEIFDLIKPALSL